MKLPPGQHIGPGLARGGQRGPFGATVADSTRYLFEKSVSPTIAPITGMMTSSVSDDDDLAERRADDHADRQIQHVALGDEGLEFKIPNLVAVVQAAAISEKDILQGVIDARARATSINITTDDLSNPEEFKKFNDAQNQLTQALGQLRTVVENYPQLASQPRFGDLMVAIDEANNQINTERVRYNDLARDYNTEIRTFPSSIAANVVHGAEPLQYFQAEEGAKANPKVDMSAITGGATN
jgi:LemA protein